MAKYEVLASERTQMPPDDKGKVITISLTSTFIFSSCTSTICGLEKGVYSTICGSKWRFPAAGRRVRYAWRPAATRAGGSKLVAAARLPAAGKLGRLRRQPVFGCWRA